MKMSKHDLRLELRHRLSRLTPAECAERSAVIARHILGSAIYERAELVVSYLALPSEPDLSAVHHAALASGKGLAYPRMEWATHGMTAMRVSSASPRTEVRRHGVPEPVAGTPVVPGSNDLILVPGLGFTSAGGRLGKGAGFYDRFIAALRQKPGTAPRRSQSVPQCVGVGFAEQILAALPSDPHDEKMDAVVTDLGWLQVVVAE